jgi:DNA-directed RNA polymerase specialized sigma24 family protein
LPSSLANAAGSASKPEDRVATFRARADRIRELKDELGPLIEKQRGDIWEMDEWGWSQHKIADVCGLSQPQIHRVLNAQR